MKKVIIPLLLVVLLLLQSSMVFSMDPDTAEALKFAKAPLIDGTISPDEWGEASKVISAGNPPNAILKEGGAVTNYSVWLRYDANNFYMAVQVADEKLVNTNTGHLLWNGDCVQFEVDPKGSWKSQGQTDYTYLSDNTLEFVFACNTMDNITYAYCFTKGEEPEGQYAVKNEEGLTTYEAAIPWSYFGVDAPQAGSAIGLTIAVLTASNYDYDGWLEWGSGCIMEKAEEDKSGNNAITLSATEFTPSENFATSAPTPKPTATKNPNEPDDKGSNLIPIVAGVAAAVIVIVIISVIIIKKKKG